jgi:aryl carrier-like protein
VRTFKNQELARLIGRRLKESLGEHGEGMPSAIRDGLDAVRRAEKQAALKENGIVVDFAGLDDADATQGALSCDAAEESRDSGS